MVEVIDDEQDSDLLVGYQDGVRFQQKKRIGEFSGTIKAFTYPTSFYNDILTQRRPRMFGLCYRTSNEHGHKIHLVYNATISPGVISYKHSEASLFEWRFSTKSIPVPEDKRSAHLIIDTTKAYPVTISALENAIYGDETGNAYLPTPDEVFEIFEANSIVRVIDHGDGSFTVIGPDEYVYMLDATSFEINWPSAVYIDAVSYRLSSL